MRFSAFVFVWIVCGIITAGANNAYFKVSYGNKVTWATKESARISCGQNFVVGLAGPIGLIVTAFMTGGFVYGLDFSCDNYEKR